MYDPKVGQFLSEDPLAFLAGDPNLRRYVGNNVTNQVDPSGLFQQGPLVPLGLAGKPFPVGGPVVMPGPVTVHISSSGVVTVTNSQGGQTTFSQGGQTTFQLPGVPVLMPGPNGPVLVFMVPPILVPAFPVMVAAAAQNAPPPPATPQPSGEAPTPDAPYPPNTLSGGPGSDWGSISRDYGGASGPPSAGPQQ